MALNHANRVAILASHISSVHWLYPTPITSSTSQANGTSEAEQQAGASKYRPFSVVEHQIRKNLEASLRNTEPDATLSAPPLLSTAISTALTYINIQTLLSAPVVGNDATNAGTLPEAGLGDLDQYTSAARTTAAGPQLVSRILVFSVSTADPSGQYISLMNGVFAAQRLNVPIDMLRIGARLDSTAFLQQASDVTHGIFLHYDPFESAGSSTNVNGATNGGAKINGNGHDDHNGGENGSDVQVMGLLQTLLMAYLPDLTARRHLVPAGSAEVDFRAACFCHGKVVSSGGVCSVCLSSRFSLSLFSSCKLIAHGFLHTP
jgi:transcription initiation factor TFIIH subunit 3